MKKNMPGLVIIFSLVFFISGCVKDTGYRVEEEWATEPVLEVPESVMYNSAKNEIYVSNISGKTLEKNGKGFISRLSLDGRILEKVWVDGFNAPKGMGIYEDTLYVTDIDRVHAIDIEKGKVRRTYSAPDAKFLNDIAVDSSGTVYISDMNTTDLYIIEDNRLSVWMNLDYKSPNGLFFIKSKLLVGTSSGIVSVNTRTKKVTPLVPHERSIDGLKPVGKKSYIVSDWNGRVEIIGEVNMVLFDKSDKKINAADFEYISGMKLLLVPTFFDNRVVAYWIRK